MSSLPPAASSKLIIEEGWVWECDVCKTKWFLNFEEACAHEKVCKGACTNCSKVKFDDIELNVCTVECQLARLSCRVGLSDDDLFKDPPEREECPVCMLTLPFDPSLGVFRACCGKVICGGCHHAQMKEDIRSGKSWRDVSLCAFCRTPAPSTDKDTFDRLNRGMKRNDPRSFNIAAIHHMEGHCGREKDVAKAMALFLRGGELGCYEAYHNLGRLYYGGEKVQKDMKKAQYLFEIAAIAGSAVARYHIGILEETVHDDLYRASKHYLISAKAGFEPALNELLECYRNGYVKKDEYAEALKAFQKYDTDTKSAMRDEAKFYEDQRTVAPHPP